MLIALLTRNRQLHIAGHRIHHGLVGKWLIVTGILLCLDDLHDHPWHTRPH